MGNMLKGVQVRDLSRTVMEDAKQDELLRELSELSEVELWRIQWGLSQTGLPQDFPPIPSHWLRSADACSTAKIIMKCYPEDKVPEVLVTVLTLIGKDHWVHPKRLTTMFLKPRSDVIPVWVFVKTQRRKLISRIQGSNTILEVLQGCRILNTSDSEAITIYAVRKDRNRALVDLVLRKGEEAQTIFYQALSQSEPFLLQELEEDCIRNKNASDVAIFMEMLEFLVSDELRCFQWLVRDLMTAERHSPIDDGEQLEHADRLTTWRLIEKYFGSKQAEHVIMGILPKIVPTLCVCFQVKAVTSQSLYDIRLATNTPQVSEDGRMFRLRCQKPGVFQCSLTGLLLEGFGDVVYEMVPWDVDFISSKCLKVAGPLFRFHLLSGSFQRLHLPHCQLLSDDGQHFLSVAHVTEDCVDFITPGQVTKSHVTIDISGFSCFGLVAPAANDQIAGLVLIFSQPITSTLFVLLLPRNVCLTQVRKEWKRRIGAEYVETIPDCELIPNQIYKLIGEPVTVIQPETSKFVNFRDYNNFLPSFQVQLLAGTTQVRLQLNSHVTGACFIGWLFGNNEREVWAQVVQLKADWKCFFLTMSQLFHLRNLHEITVMATEVRVLDSQEEDVTLQLLQMLNCLRSEDLKIFQRFLSLRPDPITVSRLEAADRTRTVDLMVQKYHAEGAKEVAEEILRRMNYNQLAAVLHSS